MALLGIIVALIIVGASAYYYCFHYLPQQAKEEPPPSPVKKKDEQTKKKKKVESKRKSATTKKAPVQKKSKVTDHPQFLRRYGGHSDYIINFAAGAEWIATCGGDGQLRVTSTTKKEVYLTLNHLEGINIGAYKAKLGHLIWLNDGRTLIGTVPQSNHVCLFRMRKKKDATSDDKFPYELVELVKRRFSTEKKLPSGELTTCLVDPSHAAYLLLLTANEDSGVNTVLWDGTKGESVGSCTIPTSKKEGSSTTVANGMRLSPDGRFLCPRQSTSSTAKQLKLYEVVKKKAKGQVEPVFDHLSSKSVMTLVTNYAVADVCFPTCDTAFVCSVDGIITTWDLNVEYKLREDPKLLTTNTELKDKGVGQILMADVVVADNVCKLAIVTANANLHILTTTTQPKNLTWLHSFDISYQEQIGDIQFCPTGNIIYTRGRRMKDVIAWNVDKKT